MATKKSKKKPATLEYIPVERGTYSALLSLVVCTNEYLAGNMAPGAFIENAEHLLNLLSKVQLPSPGQTVSNARGLNDHRG